MHTITVENAGFELALCAIGVLRHEPPDQQVLDHRIIASNGLIAPRVTMSCRLLLRRVASHGVLPRERFSPVAQRGAKADIAGLPLDVRYAPDSTIGCAGRAASSSKNPPQGAGWRLVTAGLEILSWRRIFLNRPAGIHDP